MNEINLFWKKTMCNIIPIKFQKKKKIISFRIEVNLL